MKDLRFLNLAYVVASFMMFFSSYTGNKGDKTENESPRSKLRGIC
jgi:hypothetical protein